MKRDFNKQRWLRFLFLSSCIAIPAGVVAKTSLIARYPYDPACPWGRLSNGKGMIHRCLSEDEAASVARSVADKSTTPAANKPKKDPKADTKTAPETPASLPRDVQLSIGPIVASEGEITIGRLDKPIDRYKSCVIENDGLKEETGLVVVKFLVRGEAERAEGASVQSFKGVSKKAAKCIADVVDRRKVGSPSAPMTGAQLHFKFSH